MSIQETEHGNYSESVHRRSRLEICLEILRVVKKGVKKPTRIMYAVNVSWNPVIQILELLVSQGFISDIEVKGDKRTTRHYMITQSGLKVLNYLDREKDLLRIIESTSKNK